MLVWLYTRFLCNTVEPLLNTILKIIIIIIIIKNQAKITWEVGLCLVQSSFTGKYKRKPLKKRDLQKWVGTHPQLRLWYIPWFAHCQGSRCGQSVVSCEKPSCANQSHPGWISETTPAAHNNILYLSQQEIKVIIWPILYLSQQEIKVIIRPHTLLIPAGN